MTQELLNEKEAARLLGLKPATLNCWRCTGRSDLPYVRLGRAIRYRRSDLEKFIADNAVTPNGEKGSC